VEVLRRNPAISRMIPRMIMMTLPLSGDCRTVGAAPTLDSVDHP
jgi:hypothetical protein